MRKIIASDAAFNNAWKHWISTQELTPAENITLKRHIPGDPFALAKIDQVQYVFHPRSSTLEPKFSNKKYKFKQYLYRNYRGSIVKRGHKWVLVFEKSSDAFLFSLKYD